MRAAHPSERAVGIDQYVTESEGTGGRLRATPADFRVREVEAFDVQPVDADTGSYPYVVVRATLTDWDTNAFARRLATELEMSRERVSWAGTKDKRAVTTQLFSLDGVDPEEIPDLDGAEIEILGRAGRPVLFGDLAGNEFSVVVSDPEYPDRAAQVAAELAAFATAGDPAAVGNPSTADGRNHRGGDREGTTVGVPNFFGQQRFGSKRAVTHEVGLAIVRGDWMEAVVTYVGNPSDAEPADTRKARAYAAETHDWSGALDRFPPRLDYERAMLHALSEGASYRAALEVLPTNLQQLFVHAAQSYAFNRILSDRLGRGLPLGRPVVGDVVSFADRNAPEGVALPDTDRTQRVTDRRVKTITRHCDRGRAFVTAPLVGTDTALADGVPGDIERDVLDDLGLAPGDFELPGEFDSSGTRRALMVRTDLTISWDPLTLEFRLPSGAYATVLLREFLKVDPLQL